MNIEGVKIATMDGGASLITCPYRMRAATDLGHKRRSINAGGSFRLCRIMCAKKADNWNEPVILCISQQNTQRKYNRNYNI